MTQSHATLTVAQHKADEERKARHRRAMTLWLARLTGKIIGYMALLIYPQVPLILVWTVLNQRKQTPLRQAEICQRRSESCGFAGDADYYGLGQRIAIYTQWVGCSIASAFLPAAEKTIQTSAAGFTLMVSIGLFWQLAHRNKCFYAAEAMVIFQMCLATYGFCVSSAVDRFRERGRRSEKSPFRNLKGTELIDTLLLKIVAPTPCGTSVVFMVPWIIWFRIDLPQDLSATKFVAWYYLCEAFGDLVWFATTRCRQKGWPLIAFLFQALLIDEVAFAVQTWVIGVSFCVIMVLGLPVAAAVGRLAEYRLYVGTFDWGRIDTDPQIAGVRILITSVVNITMRILVVEKTLRWNNVSGVNELNATGQLVAFVSAFGVLAALAWEKWKPYEAVPSDPERTSGLQRPDGTWM